MSAKIVSLMVVLLCTGLVCVTGCGKSGTPNPNAKTNPSAETESTDNSDDAPDVKEPKATDADRTASAAPNVQAEQLDFDQIGSLLESERIGQAKATITKHLLVYPDDPEALFMLAQTQATAGEFTDAIATLNVPAIANSDAALPAIGQSAAWYLESGQPLESEAQYRKLLRAAPGAGIAHRALADLMLKMGRPHAAIGSLRQLCLSGDVRQEELAALINVSESFSTPLIGPYATARQNAIEGKYFDAIEQLRPELEKPFVPSDVRAFFLRLLAETQDFDSLRHQLASDVNLSSHSDYWAALGSMALADQDAPSAVTAFLKALAIDSTDSKTIQRLRQALVLCNETDFAADWGQRFRHQFDAIKTSNRIANLIEQKATGDEIAQAMLLLAETLDQLERRVEAMLWRSMATVHNDQLKQQQQTLNKAFTEIVRSGNAFPSKQSLRVGVPVDRFNDTKGLETLARGTKHADDAETATPTVKFDWQPPTPAAFLNIAASLGIDHQFDVAAESQADGFATYQTLGGGVAAIDFDRDGRCDLYFAQGRSDPPNFQSESGNQLVRNEINRAVNYGRESETDEHSFSIGVAAGDWNQDGLDDIAVNQFGSIVLLTNQGDGTFTRAEIIKMATDVVPSSIAIADANNDGWLDVVAIHYASGSATFDKPKRNAAGRPINSISPTQFNGAPNQLFAGSASGWSTPVSIDSQETTAGTSLGVVIGDFQSDLSANDGEASLQKKNEIFIGNDLQNNQLWRAGGTERVDWQETAMLRGCAFGSYGNATASMGIATADLDQDGFLDLHVTNFQQEPASLYLGGQSGFRDQTIRTRLHQYSEDVLGFGSVALDYDLNGLPDIMVTNGHIDNTQNMVGTYKQPMQLFSLTRGAFAPIEVTDTSGYWGDQHVGRAIAKLDFDADGLEDVAITNVNEQSALLINQSDTDNHYVRLELIGTSSARHPVGASVVISAHRDLFHAIVAGDGYLCRHEPILTVGLGDWDQPVRVTVTWPNGKQQTFADLETNSTWQLVQDNANAFPLSR